MWGQSGKSFVFTGVPGAAGHTAAKLPTLGIARNLGVEVLARHAIFAPFLRPEEEGLILAGVVYARNVDGAADGIAVVVLFIRRNGGLKVVAGVEGIVANEFINVAMERLGAGLEFGFHRA